MPWNLRKCLQCLLPVENSAFKNSKIIFLQGKRRGYFWGIYLIESHGLVYSCPTDFTLGLCQLWGVHDPFQLGSCKWTLNEESWLEKCQENPIPKVEYRHVKIFLWLCLCACSIAYVSQHHHLAAWTLHVCCFKPCLNVITAAMMLKKSPSVPT